MCFICRWLYRRKLKLYLIVLTNVDSNNNPVKNKYFEWRHYSYDEARKDIFESGKLDEKEWIVTNVSLIEELE